MDNKCVTCGGEGLVHQGESIKYTCTVCSGTGKMAEETKVEEAEVAVPEVETPTEAPTEGEVVE